MKIYGDKGGSSIRGEAEKQEKVCEGEVCHNNISSCLFGLYHGLVTSLLIQGYRYTSSSSKSSRTCKGDKASNSR